MHPRKNYCSHNCSSTTVEGLSDPTTMYTNRIQEIQEAMQRYIDARYTIPQEWIDELNKLICILSEED